MIRFACPRCGMQLSAPEECTGRSSKCRGCGQAFQVPAPVATLVTAPSLPPIRCQCPRCQHIIEAPAAQAGQKTNCPKCGQRIQIPALPAGPPVNKTVMAPLVEEQQQPPLAQMVPPSMVQVAPAPPPPPTVPQAQPPRRDDYSHHRPPLAQLVPQFDQNIRRPRQEPESQGGQICGILSVVFGGVSLLFCPIVFGLAGIVLAIISLSLSRSKVLGTIGLIISAICFLVGIYLITTAVGELQKFGY